MLAIRMPRTPDGSHGRARPEAREIAELRQLRVAQPALAAAVDLQIAIFNLQRRIRARLPVPWFDVEAGWWANEQAAGRPLIRLKELNIDWTEFRLLFRQTVDALRQFDQLDEAGYAELQALGRNVAALEPAVAAWYESAPGQKRVRDLAGAAGSADEPDLPALLATVLTLSLQPFLTRTAEVFAQRTDQSGWRAPYCPCCGGEPDLAVITPAAERRLICGRCQSQWRFDPIACPFCANDDRTRITSFATRDGQYRIYACDACRRYLKAFDARQSTRPVMPVVDSVATLPLDAAAVQKGYRG
jgi:hypothetical protein